MDHCLIGGGVGGNVVKINDVAKINVIGVGCTSTLHTSRDLEELVAFLHLPEGGVGDGAVIACGTCRARLSCRRLHHHGEKNDENVCCANTALFSRSEKRVYVELQTSMSNNIKRKKIDARIIHGGDLHQPHHMHQDTFVFESPAQDGHTHHSRR